MTHADLVAIVRARNGAGGKVRRDIEHALGLKRSRFGGTDEWYRRWPEIAPVLALAYSEVFG